MNRTQLVLDHFKAYHPKGEWCRAHKLAKELGLTRSQASHILMQLWNNGKLKREIFQYHEGTLGGSTVVYKYFFRNAE